MINLKLMEEHTCMRINKFLSNRGYCSRKEANRIIEDNRVTVNGMLATPGQWVEDTDCILIDNEPVPFKKNVYIVLNKPKGVVCTASLEVRDNIIAFINYPDYIFPVGRLDKPSEGLILLTNDGDLGNKILEADNEHEKEYIVTVDKPFDEEFIISMGKGVDIGDTITRPCYLMKLDEITFKITLTQGLNRQIRRMTKAFGYNVIKLQRIRIMNLTLDDLEYGKWRELTSSEIQQLKSLI